jgi:hypothetical protein
MDERDVVERLRAMLADGRIPRGRAVKIFGGPGSGRPCQACARTIPRDEPEVELEFAAGPTLLLHPRCFQVLESLRHEFLV